MKQILKDFGLNRLSDYLYFALFACIIVFPIYNSIFTSISLYLIIPFLFLYSLFCKESRMVLRQKHVFIFILYFCFLFFTGIIAPDKELYFDAAKRYLGVVLSVFSVLVLIKQDKNRIRYFLLLYVVKFICLYTYAESHGLYTFNINVERASIDSINANTFGYYSFFAILSCCFLLFNVQERMSKIILCFLSFFIAYTSLNLLVIVASRAGFIFSLLSLMVGVFTLLYPFNKIKLFFISLGIIFLCILVVPNIFSSLEDTMIYNRLDRDLTEDGRVSLFEETIGIAKTSPIIGNGLGQFRVFGRAAMSHSSYTEALFEGGIIALSLYLWIMIEPFSFYRKRKYELKKNDKNKGLLLFSFFSLSLYILYNFFYVFYIGIELFLFFYLIRIFLSQRLMYTNELQ